MKLYLTAKSERASKGQGGNHYIEVSIKDETQKEIYYVALIPHREGHIIINNATAWIIKRHGGGYNVNYEKAKKDLELTKAISKK